MDKICSSGFGRTRYEYRKTKFSTYLSTSFLLILLKVNTKQFKTKKKINNWKVMKMTQGHETELYFWTLKCIVLTYFIKFCWCYSKKKILYLAIYFFKNQITYVRHNRSIYRSQWPKAGSPPITPPSNNTH